MTTAPAPGPIAFDTLFTRSWALFRRNWTVALPPVIAGIVLIAGIFAFTAAFVVIILVHAGDRGIPTSTVNLLAELTIGLLLFLLLGIVVMLWAYVAMYGMADAVWTRGTATFGDGMAAFRRRAGAALVACVGLFGLGIAAVILALPTLGIALLAFPLATMYVFPAVISGGRGGFEAIGESFRLVRRFFGPSAITLLVLYAIAYGLSFIGAFGFVPIEFAAMPTGNETVPHMPPVPLLVVCGGLYLLTTLLTLAFSGFRALALVGMYRDLSAQPDLQPQVPPYPPPPGALARP